MPSRRVDSRAARTAFPSTSPSGASPDAPPDGEYECNCFDEEKDRFDPNIEKIIEELREPFASVGRGGNLEPVTYKPGDPRLVRPGPRPTPEQGLRARR